MIYPNQADTVNDSGAASEATLTTNDFTRELTELCRKHAVGIEGGEVWPMDKTWTGPDADQWAEYVIAPDGRLVRTL